MKYYWRMPLDVKSGPEQFKDWMKRRCFNQSETAAFFGWGENVISQFVNNQRKPGLLRAVRIEELTGIPIKAWVSSDIDETDPADDASAANRKHHRV